MSDGDNLLHRRLAVGLCPEWLPLPKSECMVRGRKIKVQTCQWLNGSQGSTKTGVRVNNNFLDLILNYDDMILLSWGWTSDFSVWLPSWRQRHAFWFLLIDTTRISKRAIWPSWGVRTPPTTPSPTLEIRLKLNVKDEVVKVDDERTQMLCNLSAAWLHDSCGETVFLSLMGNRWQNEHVVHLEGTWSVCGFYMCSGWFCKQVMNSLTGWPW